MTFERVSKRTSRHTAVAPNKRLLQTRWTGTAQEAPRRVAPRSDEP
jgi:hypothetical protein